MHPLLSAILTQAQAESTAKNKWLSRQICEVLVPHLYKRTVDLDSLDALAALDNLVSHLEPSTVQESLFGLMQTLARSESDDSAVRQHVRSKLRSQWSSMSGLNQELNIISYH